MIVTRIYTAIHEAQRQMAIADAYPDVVIGCVGGGPNFAGLAYPFLADRLAGKLEDVELRQDRLDTALAELPRVPAGAAWRSSGALTCNGPADP